MPAPPKDLEKTIIKEETESVEPLQDVLEPLPDHSKGIKQVFRAISATGLYIEGHDVQPVDVINDYIRSIMEDGYRLMYVQHIRTVKTVDEIPVGEQMLYVLVKQ